VLPLLYPASLTRELQWTLGAGLLVVNAFVYLLVFRSGSRRRSGRW
jgi:hypothetical protein